MGRWEWHQQDGRQEEVYMVSLSNIHTQETGTVYKQLQIEVNNLVLKQPADFLWIQAKTDSMKKYRTYLVWVIPYLSLEQLLPGGSLRSSPQRRAVEPQQGPPWAVCSLAAGVLPSSLMLTQLTATASCSFLHWLWSWEAAAFWMRPSEGALVSVVRSGVCSTSHEIACLALPTKWGLYLTVCWFNKLTILLILFCSTTIYNLILIFWVLESASHSLPPIVPQSFLT